MKEFMLKKGAAGGRESLDTTGAGELLILDQNDE